MDDEIDIQDLDAYEIRELLLEQGREDPKPRSVTNFLIVPCGIYCPPQK